MLNRDEVRDEVMDLTEVRTPDVVYFRVYTFTDHQVRPRTNPGVDPYTDLINVYWKGNRNSVRTSDLKGPIIEFSLSTFDMT